jgi:cytochrome P450
MVCDDRCRFDPHSLDYDRNPHPIHAHLREHHRVYSWKEMDAWVLSHHADVDWLLKQAPVGTSPSHWKRQPKLETTAPTPWQRLVRETITFKEGEEHARLRRHVSRAFTPRAVARLEPRIEQCVRSALAEAAAGGECVDLVGALSSRVPMQVLGSLLGVPPEMDEAFCRDAIRLQNAINPLSDAQALAEADGAATHFETMIGILIDRATASPGEDLLSELVGQGEGDGVGRGDGKLSRRELIGIVTAIIMAGAETTGSLVNHGILALLRNPGERDLLRATPELLTAAVEELARFDFPTKFVTRYALEPLEIGGTRIDRGDLIFGALGSANRDPRVFADPDRLDLSRPPGPTLTFGAGAHFCLGASLARAEAAEMIGQLVGGFPDLELASEPRFAPHFNIRRMTELSVRLGAGAPGKRGRQAGRSYAVSSGPMRT